MWRRLCMLNKTEMEQCAAVLRSIVFHEALRLFPDGGGKLRVAIENNDMASFVDCAADPALSPVQKAGQGFKYAMYRNALRDAEQLLFREMNKRGITAIALKGEAVNSCYPPDVTRVSGDIDLFLPGKQREAFANMMKELGYRLESDIFEGQRGVDDYVAHSGIHVETHFIYFQRLGARQRKILKERGFFSMALAAEQDGYVTLRPEAHLLYMVYHAGKHLICHSLTMRMLMDLAMFVNSHAEEIDWADFGDLIRQLHLNRIANALFCFCEKHLGMRTGLWKKNGPRMETPLRLMFKGPEKDRWERFIARAHPFFYEEVCVEAEQEYRLRQIYDARGLFKNRYNFSTFVFWWLLQLIWDMEVDFTGEAV